MAIPVIANPAANSTRAFDQIERIRRLNPAPELHVTEGIGSARKIAWELAAAGHPIIVAAGGDGTVNEVINGLAQYRLENPNEAAYPTLGILPVGTMNVMACELGLPARKLEAGWEIIQSGATCVIDMWQANDHFFAQLAGVGFDAEVVQQTTWEMKRSYGPLSYAISAAQVLTQEATMLAVEIENRPLMYGPIVLIGNGKHYGGPVPVFRDASNTDGLLDVLIFHGRGPLEAMQVLQAIATNDFTECGDVDYLQVPSLRVTSPRPVPFQLDGELGDFTPVEFKLAPFRLRVACPDVP
ncbi:MAG: hypothetical protein RL693_2506 [Verrucomicrobiota bacterium]|jgi:YegS/Rv2252/BmrU family lipid kinase